MLGAWYNIKYIKHNIFKYYLKEYITLALSTEKK